MHPMATILHWYFKSEGLGEMITLRIRSEILLVALALVLSGPTAQARKLERIASCARKICLMATGIPCSVEKIARLPYIVIKRHMDIKAAKKDKVNERKEFVKRVAISSGRGPIEYLEELRLHTYDFTGKTVLDIAAGKSRFTQMINLIYGRTGAKAVSLDIKSNGPFLKMGTQWVRADAFAMPFADKSFKLTLNNWMFLFFVPQKFQPGEVGVAQMKNLERLVNEQLRVTADGGEARMGLLFKGQGVDFLSYLLTHHPRVAHVEFAQHFPFHSSLRVVMKDATPDGREVSPLKNYPASSRLKPAQWIKKGIWGTEFVMYVAAGVAWSQYKKRQLEKEREEFEELSEEVTELLRERIGLHNIVYEKFSDGDSLENIRNTKVLLERLKSLLEQTPHGKFKSYSVIYVRHQKLYSSDSSSPPILYLSSQQPVEDLQSLLFEAP